MMNVSAFAWGFAEGYGFDLITHANIPHLFYLGYGGKISNSAMLLDKATGKAFGLIAQSLALKVPVANVVAGAEFMIEPRDDWPVKPLPRGMGRHMLDY